MKRITSNLSVFICGLLLCSLTGCQQNAKGNQGTPQQSPGFELTDVESGATAGRARSQGQVVYVPCNSQIRLADGRKFSLAINLSIRNTSQTETIQVTAVEYYDTDGVLKKNYASEVLQIKPLATAEFFVGESDSSGGSGANFLVTWKADKPLTQPIVEAVMIGTGGSQGISFVSQGRLLKETSYNEPRH